MALLPIQIPPGFHQNQTQYQAKNTWFKGNLVRFSEGRLRPIGGWTRLADTQLANPVRGLHSWRSVSGERYLAVGTTKTLHLWDSTTAGDTNSPLYNVTPLDAQTGGTNVFENQSDFGVRGLGFGALDYSEEYYGTPREPIQADIFAPTWSIDNYGDDMLACHTNQGDIWYWDKSGNTFTNSSQTGTRMVKLSSLGGSSGCPSGCNGVLVTPERHVLALSPSGDVRQVMWSSQESLTAWTPTASNTAGDLSLQTKGMIVGARKTRYGTLVFTTSDVWRLNYLGAPYIYGAERLTEGVGPVGANCIAGSADFLAWLSPGRFWSYSGGYIKELDCSCADAIFSDINLDIEGLIYAGHNPLYGEIWWLYPLEGEETPTQYVIYSYRENHWTTGQLERSAWSDSGALGYPVAAGSDGYLYKHELGFDPNAKTLKRDTSAVVPTDIPGLSGLESRVLSQGVDSVAYPNVGSEDHMCYAETGAIEIGSGTEMMSVNQILTDTDAGANGLRLSIRVADAPDETVTEKGPYALSSDGFTDTRFTGRQAFLRVESPYDQEWRFGTVRFSANTAGRR